MLGRREREDARLANTGMMWGMGKLHPPSRGMCLSNQILESFYSWFNNDNNFLKTLKETLI